MVKQITTVDERKKAISEIISKILPKDKKLLIIIDELDRCNPSFAVRMLEVIKHYYNDNNTVFLLSTNNRQLVHTIKKYYGNEFDGYGYLDKFYDIVFELPSVDISKYVVDQLNIPDNGYFINTVPREISKYFNFSMRETNRYHSSLEIIKGALDVHDRSREHPEDVLTRYVFIPLALALKIRSIRLYDDFISGKSTQLIKDLCNNLVIIDTITQRASNEDIGTVTIVTNAYRRILSYERLSHDQENYSTIRAGEQFKRIIPLISMAGEINDSKE